MTLLAHISDLHLNGTPRATERVERAAAYLRSLSTPPDALLVTGDIADRGDTAAYREAGKLLDAPYPVLFCPGNHDVRGALRTELLGEPDNDRPVNTAHRVNGLTVLMCDSTIPGHQEGRLEESTTAWIERTLADPAYAGPALVAMHHPPVPVGHPLPDSVPLTNPDTLAALLHRHPQIIAVLTGHAHTAAASTFASRPILLAPAVTWTLVLPPDPAQLADREAPVGVALHFVEDDRIITHFRAVASGK